MVTIACSLPQPFSRRPMPLRLVFDFQTCKFCGTNVEVGKKALKKHLKTCKPKRRFIAASHSSSGDGSGVEKS